MKNILIAIIVLISITANAYVIQGSSLKRVMNGNIVEADAEAREAALLNALHNYFNRLKENRPNKEIPDVTTEFFKFIKSYKIANREYIDNSVRYTILADVDDVALNDLMYFVTNVVNTAVYNITGLSRELETNDKIAASFADYKFDTKYQSDFQANLRENSTEKERRSTFRKSQPQYFMDMSVLREPSAEGSCTIILTTKTYSKTKEFQTLKTKSSSESDNEDECVMDALTLNLLKTLSYVRTNFIPLPSAEKIEKTFSITAENYGNFATPKKLMDELQTRSFINSYKIISFAGSKLSIEAQTYVDADVLIKKLQSIEAEYGFSAVKADSNNILLDFTK